MNKRLGFTLSEILIALTIIGIVAALTTPRFVGNATKKQFTTKFKTTLNLLDSAAKEFKVEENGYDYRGNRTFWAGCETISLTLQDKADATLLPASDTAIWTVSGYLYYNAENAANATVDPSDSENRNIRTLSLYDDYWDNIVGGVAAAKFGKSSVNRSDKDKTLKLKNGAYIYVPANLRGCSDDSGVIWNPDDSSYVTMGTNHNLCLGFIDVNGPKGPNKFTTCVGDTRLVWPGSDATCNSVNNSTMSYASVGDVFPVWFYDDSVAPANTAANSVWLDSYDD